LNTNNQINLVGRISSDIKTVESGKMISFSIAVSRTKEITDFFNCKCFKKERIEFIQKYFKKGSLCQLIGSVQIDKKEDPNGTKYYTNVIVEDIGFLPFNKSNNEPTNEPPKSVMQEPTGQLQETPFDFGNKTNSEGIPF